MARIRNDKPYDLPPNCIGLWSHADYYSQLTNPGGLGYSSGPPRRAHRSMGRPIAQNAKSLAAHLHDKWPGFNLPAQFALAALVVLTHGMAIFVASVPHRILPACVRNTPT